MKGGIPEYEKIFAPLSKDDRKLLADNHDINDRDLKQWSAFRVVFYIYGWLARRVGDYTVPESSVIYAILHNANSDIPKNHLGLAGQQAIVPLRGSPISQLVGKNWADEHSTVSSANMAETKEQYERLMQGISDDLEDDLQKMFQ